VASRGYCEKLPNGVGAFRRRFDHGPMAGLQKMHDLLGVEAVDRCVASSFVIGTPAQDAGVWDGLSETNPLDLSRDPGDGFRRRSTHPATTSVARIGP